MLMCVATALYEYGTSVSVPVKMTCLSAGSFLLRVCVLLCYIILFTVKMVYMISVFTSLVLFMSAVRLLLFYSDRSNSSIL